MEKIRKKNRCGMTAKQLIKKLEYIEKSRYFEGSLDEDILGSILKGVRRNRKKLDLLDGVPVPLEIVKRVDKIYNEIKKAKK